MKKCFPALLLLLGTVVTPAPADEIPKEYQDAIKKGLQWMARNQSKDGHWEAVGASTPSP